MRHLSLNELKAMWERVEATVDATPDIDRWCTGLDWSLSVNAGFAPTNKQLLLEARNGAGFALLARYETSRGTGFYSGLEPLWGFGAPIFGPDPRAVVNQLVDHLQTRDDWKALYLPGMPADLVADEDREPDTIGIDREGEQQAVVPSPFTMTVAEGLTQLGPTRLIEGIVRQVADLSDGYDAWSARRSSRFRRNLRQARRRADEAGMTIEDVSTDPDLLERLMAIEVRSWKGQEGSGITTLEMGTMYRTMIERLGERGRLAAHVARLTGPGETNGHDDIGYILGGVRNRRYRGLQISFVHDSGELSVGNLLQDHQLRALCDPSPDGLPAAVTYDLGMDFDYKRRWADGAEPSVVIVVNRGRTDQLG